MSNFLITLTIKIATAVEDDDDEDDDEDEDSEGFSDNEGDEEMIDEENKDFGLKSLLEEDENKQSQVNIDPSSCQWLNILTGTFVCA